MAGLKREVDGGAVLGTVAGGWEVWVRPKTAHMRAAPNAHQWVPLKVMAPGGKRQRGKHRAFWLLWNRKDSEFRTCRDLRWLKEEWPSEYEQVRQLLVRSFTLKAV